MGGWGVSISQGRGVGEGGVDSSGLVVRAKSVATLDLLNKPLFFCGTGRVFEFIIGSKRR